MLAMVRAPILHDHLVNNLPTGDAFPPEKKFAIAIKFFIDHHSTTTITPHMGLLYFSAYGKACGVPRLEFKGFP